jgi:hypothetical protein
MVFGKKNPRYAYSGHFHLDKPKVNNRYIKTQPPKHATAGSTIKEADFLQYGYDQGYLCIECKNYREWLYPRDTIIKELIIKSYELKAIPVIIDRIIHYTTKTNLFIYAGIIAHESYYQYYPADYYELADKVKHKNSLGFTDIVATEVPDHRTVKFFETDLIKIVPKMANKWNTHRNALYDFAKGEINLSQLYTAIGSQAGGKWKEKDEPQYDEYEEEYDNYDSDDEREY